MYPAVRLANWKPLRARLRARAEWVIDLTAMALLFCGNAALRDWLPPYIPNQMVGGFSDIVERLWTKHPLGLLLPMLIGADTARAHWTTTGLVLVDGLRRLDRAALDVYTSLRPSV